MIIIVVIMIVIIGECSNASAGRPWASGGAAGLLAANLSLSGSSQRGV